MLQFTQVSDRTLGLGLNQDDSPDQISEGYIEDGINVDVDGSRLVRRNGYEKYCGDIPLRVETMILTRSFGNTYGEFLLPEYVNLEGVTQTPIELELYYYRSGSASPVLFSSRYAESEWLLGDRYTFDSGSTTATLTSLESGVTSVETLIGFQATASHEAFFVGGLTLDTATFDMTIEYSTPSDLESFVYRFEPEAANKYYDDTIVPGTSIDILGSTHNLPTSNILPVIYSVDAGLGVISQIFADEITINQTSADINFSFNETPAGDTLAALLVSVPAEQIVEGTTDGTSSSTTVTIENADSTQIFAVCYMEDIVTSTLTLIYPESITYNSTDNSHEVLFNHPGEAFNYVICYTYGTTSTNKIIIPDMGSGTILNSDGTEVITRMLSIVRGINQEELPTKSFVNFIDNYVPSSEVIVGTDGLLLKSGSVNYSELFDARSRVSPSCIVGPTFKKELPVADERRTVGFVVSSGINSSGYGKITAVRYEAPYTVYTMSVPSYAAYDNSAAPVALSSVINTSRDKLLVSRLTNVRFNGQFTINSITELDANTLEFSVTNTSVNKAIWDTSNVSGLGGIFTDEISFNTNITAPSGSTIAINTSNTITVESTATATKLYVSGVTDTHKLNNGLRLGYSATNSSILSGFDLTGSSLLVGDIVQVGDIVTRVEEVNTVTGSVTFRENIEVLDGLCTINTPCRWDLIYPADDKLGVDVIDRSEVIRSVMGRGSLYLANGVKYDGDKTYRTGIPYIQSQMALTVSDGSGIPVIVQSVTYSSGSTTRVITFSDAVDFFSVGDVVIRRNTNGSVITIDPSDLYVVEAVDTTNKKLTFDKNFTVSAGGTDTLCKYTEYQYFIRLSIVDRNGNYLVGASVGSSDMRVRLTGPGKVGIRGWILPSGLENLDYDRLNFEIFRRNNTAIAAGSTVGYRKVGQIPLSGKSYYVDYLDSMSDEVLSSSDEDQITDPLGGIGETRSAPYTASCITGINNQLVYSNLTAPHALNISFLGDATEANFSTFNLAIKHYFTEDRSGALTTTSFKVGTSHTVSTAAFDSSVDGNGTNGAAITLAATVPADSKIVVGNWVYIANIAPTNCNAQPTLLGWHKVVSYASGVLKIALPDITAVVAADYTNTKIYYHDATGADAGKVPLTNEIDHMNFTQSIAIRGSDIRVIFPIHLTSAMNVVLNYLAAQSQLSPIYSTGSRDRSTGNWKVEGNRLYSLTFPAAPASTLSLYIGGANAAWSAEHVASSKTYPARSILSVPRFPEVFADIEVDTALNTPQVQDVNPEDGNPIVAAIPFFADTAFGAALKSNVLTILKPKGIYILDSQAKWVNSNDFFKKIDTRGIGCEAPGSVIASADGILFASRDGIYLIDKSFRPVHIGNKLKKFWSDGTVDLDKIDQITASNYTRERQIRFSYPTTNSSNYSDGVFSLKFGEAEMPENFGAWTRYTGFNASGWASSATDTFFSTDQGFVGKVLKTGSVNDYSDAGTKIDAEITFRAMDMGMPNSRKMCKFVTIYTISSNDNNTVLMSIADDLSTEFTDLNEFTLPGNQVQEEDLLSDILRNKVDRTTFSPPRSHSTWFQVKVTAEGNHSDFEITKVIYKVAALRTRGEAQSSQKS
jgi:hypothetical protein